MRCLQLSHAITTFQSRGGVQTETAAKLFGWDAVPATVPRNYNFSKSRWCANAKWRLPEYCPIEPYSKWWLGATPGLARRLAFVRSASHDKQRGAGRHRM